MSRLSVALRLALALGLSSASGAHGLAAAPASTPVPVSITLSGGVSLGAYEAGALYYVVETARANPGRFELKLVTGASAGALNGLLAILSSCGEGSADPTESLLWRMWLPLGFNELFVPAEASRLGALSVRPLEAVAALVEGAFRRGVPKQCDVVLGVTITRSEPRSVRTAHGRLALDRMEEKVAVRIRGRGFGLPPSVRNQAEPGDPLGGLLLVTDAAGEIGFPALRELLLASAAFPAAFPPRSIRHCEAPRERAALVCLDADARDALFVDGGLLDNAPLRFAFRLAGAGWERRRGGGTRWRDPPDPGERAAPAGLPAPGRRLDALDGALFAFITPDIADYPEVEFTPRRPTSHSLATLLSRLVGGFVATSRSKELATLLEEQPELAAQVLVHRRHAPAASAPLAAFFGFFERELRAFDFALGLYDSWRLVEEDGLPGLVRPEQPQSERSLGWRAFACVRSVLEREGSAASTAACAGEGRTPLRILLQTSLERLYSDCAVAGAAAVSASQNPFCQDAGAGGAPPRLAGVRPLAQDGWRRRPDEDEVAFTFRLLVAHRFPFHDLGLRGDQADEALPRIRERLGEVAERVAALQPRDDRTLVTLGTTAAVNALAYAPPPGVLHLTLGPELELGWSGRLGFQGPRLPWLRLALVAQVRGLGDLLSSGENVWAWALAVGLELQPRRWSSIATQVHLGVRAGFLAATGDGFATGRCGVRDAARADGCSRPFAEGLLGLTTLERFRLQLGGKWFPPHAGHPGGWTLAPGIGLEWPL